MTNPINTKNKFLLNREQAQHEFLNNVGSNINVLIQKFKAAQNFVRKKKARGPKYPVEPFCYEEQLSDVKIPTAGRSSAEVFRELADILDGSFRPQSHNSLFNMVPNPLQDTIVASMLMQVNSNNSIMDSYGGKSILFEQKVARSLGAMVGWQNAYGVHCNGGKLTLFYAIKCAIHQIAGNAPHKGIPNDLVILVSAGAHYSIEHTCSMVGLGSENCIRIPIDSADGITKQGLQKAFYEQLERGKRIAAIICCGGTTIDFICEETRLIYQVTDELVKLHQLDYFPYLHVDSVIGWLWFTFLGMRFEDVFALTQNREITLKINEVTTKFKDVKNFDSFGVDMHKNGLCPYSSSFFIAKEKSTLTGRSKKQVPEKMYYGDIRAFTYTLENTRSSGGIASAWTALQRMGINGFREYLIRLMQSSQTIQRALEKYPVIKILNQKSLGWEIVFSVKFKLFRDEDNNVIDANCVAETFIQYIWNKINKGENFPNFSIVKNYPENFKQDEEHAHAFIIYNMQINISDKVATKIAKQIIKAVETFEQEIEEGKQKILYDALVAPIR